MSESSAKPKLRTKPFDPVEYLHTERDIIGYLNAAIEENDAGVVALAVGDAARARGMSEIAREANLGRESLYKSLSFDGNPTFSTIMRVLGALGLRLRVEPIEPKRSAARKRPTATKKLAARGAGAKKKSAAKRSPKAAKR